MPTRKDYAVLELLDALGARQGSLRLLPIGASRTGSPAPIEEATPEEMVEWAEERVQLLENRRYEYEVSGELTLRLVEGVVTRSALNERTGTIETGSKVGLLTLKADGPAGVRAWAAVEVRSTKLDYRRQYRRMLEDITDSCSDLLLQVRAPAQGLFRPDPNEDSATIAQRYSFLKHLLTAPEFRNAIARVLADPHTKPVMAEDRREIGRGFRADGRTMQQLLHGHPRRKVPHGHPLKAHMDSVPTHITARRQADTLDTAENRFVRYALDSFAALLADMKGVLLGKHGNSPWSRRLMVDIEELHKTLDATLGAPLFRELSPPTSIDLGSPVLQRRAGYREVLRAWLRFSAASRLVWEGGLDVYGGGKRDVAALYEYWVFFRLLDAVTRAFGLPKPSAESLIEPTADGFALKLKAGRKLFLDGHTSVGERELRVRFAYNRTFSGKPDGASSHPKPGSWTRIMRPDYTLSVWPSALSEGEAETYELMTHIHFDAKYKLDSGHEASDAPFPDYNNDTVPAGGEGTRLAGRVSTRTDLLTLHSYRDAIRRTEGAYVIYPGDRSQTWRSHHELLPGLGAFAIKPDNPGAGMAELDGFLREVAEHISNRATASERTRYYQHLANLSPTTRRATVAYPETTPDGVRAQPPQDHMVLNCTPRSMAQATWFANTLRFDLKLDGEITPELVGAKHLLVRGLEPGTTPLLYRTDKVLVMRGEAMRAAGHPDVVCEGAYMVFYVIKEMGFGNAAWRLGLAAPPGYYAVDSLANLLASF